MHQVNRSSLYSSLAGNIQLHHTYDIEAQVMTLTANAYGSIRSLELPLLVL